MNDIKELSDIDIVACGVVSNKFLGMGIKKFKDACDYVKKMPYGYNSSRENILVLFEEGKGSCTTKHSVIAALGEELNFPIYKHIGIYAMTDDIVSGTTDILIKYKLPYLPMVHCFLKYENLRFDLTEGNSNGKNKTINDFLYTEKAAANISENEEYMIYRKALNDKILKRAEMANVDLKSILQARADGLILLKSKVHI